MERAEYCKQERPANAGRQNLELAGSYLLSGNKSRKARLDVEYEGEVAWKSFEPEVDVCTVEVPTCHLY